MRKRRWRSLKTKAILKALKEIKGESCLPISILVIGEEKVGKKSLIEKITSGKNEIFSLVNLTPKDSLLKFAPKIDEADLVLVAVDATKKISNKIMNLLEHLESIEKPFLLVVNKIDIPKDLGAQLETVSDYLERFLPNIVLVSALKDVNISDELIPAIIRRCSKKMLSLAIKISEFKLPVIKHIIKSTALQNAVIAGIPLYPGADMPLLTTNQIRMILKIAAVYEKEIGLSRAKEIIMAISGGFIFRAIARELLSFLPLIGFATKAAVAYGGTIAIGEAANKYFEKGISDLSAEEIKDIALEAARELKVAR
ncbi:hypothetical protein [Candidatus Oleimmundimicrobium sp.]|uniref:hypothetical protein n=1 Tax=Candidatus Oleimmundimicrobium sp. TaxID=3060597 RepID=UPI00271AF336|nr:hypothetical protein [Candidatus Oleimmundimicrobium sp.]MDO8886143.1 hypothetical protein [Candidatus Oleimmundimicrobium sp.]